MEDYAKGIEAHARILEAYARLLEGYASLGGSFIQVSEFVIILFKDLLVIYSCRHHKHVLEDYANP